MQPQRPGVADEHAEDPAAARQVADPRMRVLVDAVREEALELRPGLVDHAERGVTRAGEPRGRLDEPLQDGVERELGAEGDSDVHERPQAPAALHLAALRRHAASIAGVREFTDAVRRAHGCRPGARQAR